jgi:hypothetical protein
MTASRPGAGQTNTPAKARQQATAHPIIRRCKFAPNWPISARMTLNVPDWQEANIRRYARPTAQGRANPITICDGHPANPVSALPWSNPDHRRQAGADFIRATGMIHGKEKVYGSIP